MSEYNFRENYLYEQIPRFVENSGARNSDCLSIHETVFTWCGHSFIINIVPAQLRKSNALGLYLLPGLREKAIEQSLIKLAAKNPRFCFSKRLVTFSLSDLVSEIRATDYKNFLSEQEIDQSLRVLKGALYQVFYGERELHFNSLESLTRSVEDGETIYSVRFPPFVFSDKGHFNDFFENID